MTASPHAIPSGHRRQLDGLRAWAVLIVFLSHYHHALVGPWTPLGEIGVGIFFVLSGFLITGILMSARDDADEPGRSGRVRVLGAFVARRALRILPAYVALIAVMWFDPESFARDDAVWFLTHTINVKIHLDGFWPGNLAHIWTLSIEEHFYLVWPLVMLFVARHRTRDAVMVVVLVCTAARLAAPHATTIPPAAFQGLAVGALLTVLVRERPDLVPTIIRSARWSATAWFALTVGLATTGWAVFDAARYLPMYAGFAALVLLAARGVAGPSAMALDARPLRALGRISYGVYLWHLAPMFVLESIGVPIDPLNGRGPITSLFALAATIAIALVSFHLLEQPINRLKRHVPYVVGEPAATGDDAVRLTNAR